MKSDISDVRKNKTGCISSVQSLSRVRLFATQESQHTRPPCPSLTPGVHSDSRPSSQWCYPDISSSVIPFSSCPQSFPASGSFQMSQLFTSGGHSIGASVSSFQWIFRADFLQDWLVWSPCCPRDSQESSASSTHTPKRGIQSRPQV